MCVSIDGGRRIASQPAANSDEISFASNIPRIITGPYFLAILYNIYYKELLLLVASGYLLLSSLPNCEYIHNAV